MKSEVAILVKVHEPQNYDNLYQKTESEDSIKNIYIIISEHTVFPFQAKNKESLRNLSMVLRQIGKGK